MLGTRTKQISSYGRRGSRVVNVSDRPANSSETVPHVDTIPARRENATIVSPTKPHVGRRRVYGSSRSPKTSPLAQNRIKAAKDPSTKRMHPTSTHTRPPLTPLRLNGTGLSNGQPKGKSKASTAKRTRTSLKHHASVIAVDIVVLDEDGNTLTQEHRLSHTEVQPNQAPSSTGTRKKSLRSTTSSPPSVPISVDSDLEVVSPYPVVKRKNHRSRPIVISSDESEVDGEDEACNDLLVPLAKFTARSKSLRVEVVIPAPSQKSLIPRKPPGSPPLTSTPRTSVPPIPAFRPRPAAGPSFLDPHIPVTKPRQLTPIRSRLSHSIFRRLPPTPSTPTEADLSLDLAQLDISDVTEIGDFPSVQPEYLKPLLNECAQTSPHEFSAFIDTFPFDPVVQSSAEDEAVRFRKIGEASYSEVFGIGDVVLKIIPIRFEEESAHLEMGEVPAPSDTKDVLKEIIVTKEIGKICDKFVKLLKTYVVKGRYPSLLLDLWDEYNKRKGSESIRPDSFALTQVYAIIILPNGGPDLESFAFKNVSKCGWHQACGIFWQVVRALEQAEHLVNFEHRDLHWGQILVKNIPIKRSTNKSLSSRVAMDDARFGVKVTIIDLGLSRMSAADANGSKTYWTPFDSEIFEGEGDYQYDIYRIMRDFISGAWKSFHPFTNVMWLHYLVTKLLHEKRLKVPGGKKQTGAEVWAGSTGYDERECHDCLVEMERLLGNCIASVTKARRKAVVPSGGPKSATEVVAYGMRRGWIR